MFKVMSDFEELKKEDFKIVSYLQFEDIYNRQVVEERCSYIVGSLKAINEERKDLYMSANDLEFEFFKFNIKQAITDGVTYLIIIN